MSNCLYDNFDVANEAKEAKDNAKIVSSSEKVNIPMLLFLSEKKLDGKKELWKFEITDRNLVSAMVYHFSWNLFIHIFAINPNKNAGNTLPYIWVVVIEVFIAFEHSLTIWGIFLTMIWALPLSISYIKTKNIYIPMTAHFVGNLLGNGVDVIITIISML